MCPNFAVVEAQNALTNSVLERCGTREKFKDLMTRLYNYERFSCPFKRGSRCALACTVCGVADCIPRDGPVHGEVGGVMTAGTTTPTTRGCRRRT